MSEVKQVLLWCRTRKKPSASSVRFIVATCGRFVLVRVRSVNRGDGGPRRVSGLRVKSPPGSGGEAAGEDIEDEACQPACRKTLPFSIPRDSWRP
ncbi:unnamed protein product [Boreogadus saida]